jgi:hypothetical protein
VVRAGRIFKYFAGEALRLLGERLDSVREGIEVEILREPEGVVGIITPWNSPMAIPAWKISPALAYGNTIVFKPSEMVPPCTWHLADILVRAGTPPGVFNLVMGKGSVVGSAIVESRGVHAVTFTGSVPTGSRVVVACMERGKKVQLELGGKNPLVVAVDADLDIAVSVSVKGSFFSTGERCTASSRLMVEDAIHDRFVDRMVETLAGLKVDNALNAGTDIGPVASEAQLRQDLDYNEIGRNKGARLAFGGDLLKRATPGHYLAPALFGLLYQLYAYKPGGGFRAGRVRDPGTLICGCVNGRERHALWTGIRNMHDLVEAGVRFQTAIGSRDGDGERAHCGGRLPCPVRRQEGVVLRLPRAGPPCSRVLHVAKDSLHPRLKIAHQSGSFYHASSR